MTRSIRVSRSGKSSYTGHLCAKDAADCLDEYWKHYGFHVDVIDE